MSSGPPFTFWAIVPAAGRSRRMGAIEPKQYLPLAGRTVIEIALAPFLARTDCAGIIVALSADDDEWAKLPSARESRIRTVIGGAERADSVRAALAAIDARADDSNWIVVHDAARPCLTPEALSRLVDALHNDAVGGLLAVPVVDTLKRSDASGRVGETVSRAGLWQAQTPQMFRRGLLTRALDDARQQGQLVTDEAQAIERLGFQPKLVEGDADNLKITVMADLERARRVLAARTGR